VDPSTTIPQLRQKILSWVGSRTLPQRCRVRKGDRILDEHVTVRELAGLGNEPLELDVDVEPPTTPKSYNATTPGRLSALPVQEPELPTSGSRFVPSHRRMKSDESEADPGYEKLQFSSAAAPQAAFLASVDPGGDSFHSLPGNTTVPVSPSSSIASHDNLIAAPDLTSQSVAGSSDAAAGILTELDNVISAHAELLPTSATEPVTDHPLMPAAGEDAPISRSLERHQAPLASAASVDLVGKNVSGNRIMTNVSLASQGAQLAGPAKPAFPAPGVAMRSAGSVQAGPTSLASSAEQLNDAQGTATHRLPPRVIDPEPLASGLCPSACRLGIKRASEVLGRPPINLEEIWACMEGMTASPAHSYGSAIPVVGPRAFSSGSMMCAAGSFESARRRRIGFVDKSMFVGPIAQHRRVLLCRPRGFGKSFLCSMLDSYFRCRNYLFAGLAVDGPHSPVWDDGQRWAHPRSPYPVVALDVRECMLSVNRYAEAPASAVAAFRRSLLARILAAANGYGVIVSKAGHSSPSAALVELLRLLAAHPLNCWKSTVVLCDNVDAAWDDARGYTGRVLPGEKGSSIGMSQALAMEVSNLMSAVEAAGSTVRLAFMTSSTPGMQHVITLAGLKDLTASPDVHASCGFTWTEARAVFGTPMQSIMQRMRLTPESLGTLLTRWYGGYRFVSGADSAVVFAPASVMSLVDNGDLLPQYPQLTAELSTYLAQVLRARHFFQLCFGACRVCCCEKVRACVVVRDLCTHCLFDAEPAA
jgi:hypothetical protein